MRLSGLCARDRRDRHFQTSQEGVSFLVPERAGGPNRTLAATQAGHLALDRIEKGPEITTRRIRRSRTRSHHRSDLVRHAESRGNANYIAPTRYVLQSENAKNLHRRVKKSRRVGGFLYPNQPHRGGRNGGSLIGRRQLDLSPNRERWIPSTAHFHARGWEGAVSIASKSIESAMDGAQNQPFLNKLSRLRGAAALLLRPPNSNELDT